MNAALRFKPYLRPMVWGGHQLTQLLGHSFPEPGPHGEAWQLSDHPLHRSVVSEGPYQGQTLRRLMEEQRDDLLGPAAGHYSTFPWLIKLLDAWDWLSVQVHPNEHSVRHLWPGENSKTEAWFILTAAPGSRIYAGVLPGVNEARLRTGLATGRVAECLHSFEPQPGDCIFLPAGTVHAVGGGILMAEIQQTSDATFRLYDWDRRDGQGQTRKLHIDEALACIDWDQGPVLPIRVPGYGTGQDCVRQELVRCPYFTLEYRCHSQPFTLEAPGRMQAAVVLHGQAQVTTGMGSSPLQPGDTLLLPALRDHWSCTPHGSLGILLATLPDPL